MQNIYWAIALFCGIIGGVAFGYQLRKIWAFKRKDTIEAKIENLINEAKTKQKTDLTGRSAFLKPKKLLGKSLCD